MSTINDSDLLLVERNGNLHQITYDQMSTLNDDDILLVERGGVQYKVEAQYVSTGPNGVILPSVEVLTPVNGAGLNDGDPYTPMSSAYVSTDTTPITYRHFPELITTVSGGSWVDENKMFNGSQSYFSELTGAAGVVSQAVFTPQTGWTEAQTTVWAYVTNGGTVEVLDENDAVLRSYALLTSFQEVGNDIGIVRADQKIRFSTNNQNESLFISRISGAPTDYYINGRVAFEFTDDTDLDKMVAPIIQTDENGNVKIPTTSTVDSTTTIPGEPKATILRWTGYGSEMTWAVGASGPGSRMVWAKADTNTEGIISDNVVLNGNYLETSNYNGYSIGGPDLQEDQSVYPVNNKWNDNGSTNYIAEIGVAPKVLDIVEYTGNTTGPREIKHNLGCKPGMIIIKNAGGGGGYNWVVWHKDNYRNTTLRLNTTEYAVSNGLLPVEPTADAFYISHNTTVNQNNNTYVAYVFAADHPDPTMPGKVYCGRYTGNGSNGGQNITIPGAPKAGFLLIKRIDSNQSWVATTLQAQASQKYWYPNLKQGFTGSSGYYVGFLSAGGFFVIGGDNDYNAPGGEYIYLYVANELTGPNSTQLNLLGGQDLEYFTDGTEITSNAAASGSNISFQSHTYTGNGSEIIIQPYTPPGFFFFDTTNSSANKWLTWIKSTQASYRHSLLDSERNPQQALDTTLSYADNGGANEYFIRPASTTGFVVGNGTKVNSPGAEYISWNFLGSPQFFDIQKYIGTSGTNSIAHDLGTEPGCIIIKSISQDAHWWVYHSDVGRHQYLTLNRSVAASYSANWISTPTDSQFVVNSGSSNVNTAGVDYISYIFAKDTPYVKCGSYTGSGGGTQVNVGFQPRWMLIKRTNADANWIILDKTEGNKYLEPNGNGGFGTRSWSFTTTGINLIDEDNSVNGSGGSYIYVAIADEAEGHPPFPPSSTTVQGTPDVNAATMVVNAESFDVGDSASAAPLEASITSVAGSDGNKLLVDGSTGTWVPGLYAKGSETTIDAPGPDEITFTSQNQGTPIFSGVDATLASRTWTLESGTTSTGPWTLVDTYVDYDVLNSQTGATPWTSNKPNLTPNTFYRVKVQYNSTNAESVESVYNTFKTGDA